MVVPQGIGVRSASTETELSCGTTFGRIVYLLLHPEGDAIARRRRAVDEIRRTLTELCPAAGTLDIGKHLAAVRAAAVACCSIGVSSVVRSTRTSVAGCRGVRYGYLQRFLARVSLGVQRRDDKVECSGGTRRTGNGP